MFGQDVARKGGVYGVTRGLLSRFGACRVFDTLLDEQAILGLALGAWPGCCPCRRSSTSPTCTTPPTRSAARAPPCPSSPRASTATRWCCGSPATPTRKASAGTSTTTTRWRRCVGGRKQPVRALSAGVATSEDIYVEDPPVDATAGRPLLVSLVESGEVVVPLGAAGVAAARAHHAAAMAELPPQALSLSLRGEPAIPTRYL